MTDFIRNILSLFKPHWKWTVFLFIFTFSIFYYTGNMIEWVAVDWKDGTGDIEKLGDIGTMVMHGVFFRAYASLWSMAPILVTLALTMANITLYFSLARAKKEGKSDRPFQIVGIFNAILFIGLFYFIVLK